MTSPVIPEFDEALQLLVETQIAYIATTNVRNRAAKLRQCQRFINQLSHVNKPLLNAIIETHLRNLQIRFRSLRGLPNSRH